MNKIHRTVWSKSRQCFVVASETAKAKGKASTTRAGTAQAVATALLALGALGSGQAWAQADVCTTNGGSNLIGSNTPNSICYIETVGESVTVSGGGGIGSASANPAIYVGANGPILDNSGSIQAGYGVQVTSSAHIAGITNRSGGTIAGSLYNAIAMNANTVVDGITNAGTISSIGAGRPAIRLNGSSSSAAATIVGSITNEPGGTISGSGSNSDGIEAVRYTTITGDIDNAGKILGTRRGITIQSSLGNINNTTTTTTTGTISGVGEAGIFIGTNARLSGGITNSGSIAGGTSGGVALIGGATLVGGILNQAGGVISVPTSAGFALAVGSSGSQAKADFIGNNGQLTGIVKLYSANITGATGITNSVSGTISGGDTGLAIDYASTVAGGITNSGNITGIGPSIRTCYWDIGCVLPSLNNLFGGLIDGQLAIDAQTNVTNAGTIALLATSVAGDAWANSYIGFLASARGWGIDTAGSYIQTASGVLRTKVANTTTYGNVKVNGTVTLPANAKFDVLTGDAATCRGITVGGTLAGVISATTLTWNNGGTESYLVTDDCDGMDFQAVRSGQNVDLVAIAPAVTYAVTGATNNSGFGTVSCPSTVVDGATATCTGTASGGYQLNSAAGSSTLCGTVSVSGTSITAGPVTGACTVTGTFGLIPASQYTITTAASPSVGGSVACSPNPVTSGGSSTCTPSAATGYTFSTFSGDCSGATCTLTNVTSTKSVTATFVTVSGSIAGQCGPANGVATLASPTAQSLCNAGTATGLAAANGGFAWNCLGSGGGATAQCVAPGVTPTGNTGSITGSVTFELLDNGGCRINSLGLDNSLQGGPGNGVVMPFGVVQFELLDCTRRSVTAKTTYSSSVASMQFYKYMSRRGGWINVPTSDYTLSQDGKSITLTITDNGPYDNSLTDFVIVDPGGPGYVPNANDPQSIPTLSEWGLIALTGLMGLFGLRQMRRRDPHNRLV
jgi:hypothetical protein